MSALRLNCPAVVRTALTTLLLLTAGSAVADDAEVSVKRARNGGGLRFGFWDVRGLEAPAGGSAHEGFVFEGYFQKGLDLHLAWENTLGFWHRRTSSTEPDPLGGQVEQEVRSYIVPTLTSLKLFPLTRPESPVEPFLSAGLGLVLAFDREQLSSTNPLGTNDESSAIHTGLGLEAGAGIDLHPGGPFGLTIGGGYRWTGFSEDVGGRSSYEGWGADIGVTYRFQYQ